MPFRLVSSEVRAAALAATGTTPEEVLDAAGPSDYECPVCGKNGSPATEHTAILLVEDPRAMFLQMAHASCSASRVTTLRELAREREHADVQPGEQQQLLPGRWAGRPALYHDFMAVGITQDDGGSADYIVGGLLRLGFTRPADGSVPPRVRSGWAVRLDGDAVDGIGDGRQHLWRPGQGPGLPADWAEEARHEGTVIVVAGDLGFPVTGTADPAALSMDRIIARAACGTLPIRE